MIMANRWYWKICDAMKLYISLQRKISLPVIILTLKCFLFEAASACKRDG